MRIFYIFTTFPKPSEKFLERELTELAEHPSMEITIFSLAGGRGNAFGRFPLRHFNIIDAILFPWRLVAEVWRDAHALGRLLRLYLESPPNNLINFLENLIGVIFGITYAHRTRQDPPDHIHAVWATAPGAAAMFLSQLTGVPYSMGAHAYDIHRDGGDCLLKQKAKGVRFIHTSTIDAKRSMQHLGIDNSTIHVIRRGLNQILPIKPISHHSETIRLISIGRLIEKKGYFEQLALYENFLSAGLNFEATIVGSGPLKKGLEQYIEDKGLSSRVRLAGALSYAEVQELYTSWGQIFLFTGKIARSGDRDGFPNVIGEAMASGLVVLSTAIAGVPEVIESGRNGYLLDVNEPDAWLETIRKIQSSPEQTEGIRREAHAWVSQNFDQKRNTQQLIELFSQSVG